MSEITSIANKKIKELIKLKDNQKRKKLGVFLCEGKREIMLLIKSRYLTKTIIVCNKYLDGDGKLLLNALDEKSNINPERIEVSANVYDTIAYKKGQDGIIVKAEVMEGSFNNISHKEKNVVVLESIEKPGNLGAICRTLDSAGIKTIILTNSVTDEFNPNAIRSSLGTVLLLNIIKTDNETAQKWANNNKYSITATSAKNSKNLYAHEFGPKNLIVFGSEDKGLSDYWEQEEISYVKIPMKGMASSLNLSVACALVVYEQVRQSSAGK